MTTRLPKNIEDAYPLAPLQSGMLFHSTASEGTGVYIEQLLVRLSAKNLNVEVFKLAWAALTDRHPVLRTSFIWKNIKQPLQLVHKSAELTWIERDYRDKDVEGVKQALADFQHADRLNDFDLLKPPMQRMALIRTSNDQVAWIWTRHHIIADGWSTSILLRELSLLYDAFLDKRASGLPPIRPYRDYISSLNTADEITRNDFWKTYLDGLEAPMLLSERVSRTVSKSAGFETQLLHLEESTSLNQCDTELLKNLCRSCRVTLNTAVQGAWCLLLERYAGQDDVTWGSVFSGRSENLTGAEQIVGLMINTVPVRQRVNPEQTVGEFLRDIQTNLLSVMEFEQTPLPIVQSLSPLGSGVSLFDTVLVFENYPRNAPKDDTLEFGNIEYHEQSNLPLALIVIPGNQLELILIHSSRFFSEEFCKKLLSEFHCLLSAMATDERTPVGQLPAIPNSESEKLLALSKRNPDSSEDNTCLLHPDIGFIDKAIRECALTNADAVAIRFQDRSICYDDLETISSRRAHSICDILFRNPTRVSQSIVALYLPRTEDVVVWMIAVLKAGAAYLILDQSQPIKNLQQMLKSSAASLLITDGTEPDLGLGLPLLQLDTHTLDAELDNNFKESLDTIARDHADTAYILYTSGSSGKPKGVAVSHKSLLASTRARFNFYSSQPENFLLLSSFSFDSSVAGIYWTLTAGGTLVVSPTRLEQDMLRLAETIQNFRITHTLCLPSLYRLLLETVELAGQASLLATLNTIITAGEVVQPLGLLDRHQKMLPGTVLVNEYGPTEAAVWCCGVDYSALSVNKAVPIGRPVGNNRLYVLDHLQRLAPRGAVGQLAIAGDQISHGYWQNQTQTSLAFRFLDVLPTVSERVYLSGDQASWREDGNLDFLGRNDGQVKIRGHRVEIAGVEHAICMDGWIDEAAVIAIPPEDTSRPTQVKLAAFIVVSSDISKDKRPTSIIRERLISALPHYMVPTIIEVRDSLPKLSNQKIDRHRLVASLSEIEQQFETDQKPETDQERQLHKIWIELLGSDQIGVNDNFFELGGDSIMSIRLLSSLASIGFTLDPNAVFESPTIRELATRTKSISSLGILRALPLTPIDQVALNSEFGSEAEHLSDLSESQSAYLFSWMRTSSMDPGHVQIQSTISGLFSDSQLKDALDIVVNRHEALRTAIHSRGRDKPVQVIYRKIDIKWSQEQVSTENSQLTVNRYLMEDRAKRLSLDSPQVWRIRLFRISHLNSILCWSFHHSLVDGWSAAIVIRSIVDEIRNSTLSGITDASKIGDSPASISPNSKIVRYRDYLYWLSEQKLAVEETKWKNYLARLGTESRGLPLPDREQTSAIKSVSIEVKGPDWNALRESIRDKGTTLSRLIHACWGLALSVASENQRIGFSTTVSGRNIPIEGSEEIVGQLVNHLPVLFESSATRNVRQTLIDLADSFTLISGLEHVPASKLVSWSGGRGNTNSCVIGEVEIASLIMIENFPWNDSASETTGNITLSSFQRRGDASSFTESGSASVFPITLVVVPEINHLQLQLHYRESLFSRDSASELLLGFRSIALRWSQDGIGNTDLAFESSIQNFFSEISQRLSNEKAKPVSGQPPVSQLEKSFARVWSELFGRKIDDIDLNFFDLGGTSLQAVNMVESIRENLDIRLPLSLLIENPTIKSLVAAISADKHITNSLLVSIQPAGKCQPIFGIHAEGNVFFYKPLANILGKKQPFYGVQTPELVNIELRCDSVEAVASEYIQQIKKVQTEGPYSILGMCFGGWIAFEMAKQLLESGEQIDLLCVLDSDAPGQTNFTSQLKAGEPIRTTKGAANFAQMSQVESIEKNFQPVESENFWQRRFHYHRNAPLLIKALVHLRTGRFFEVTENYLTSSPTFLRAKKRLFGGRDEKTNQSLELIHQIRSNQTNLISKYNPASIETDIIAIFSDQFSRRVDWNRQIGHWKSLCKGNFESHIVSGNHLEILRPANVEQVAAIVGPRAPANKTD